MNNLPRIAKIHADRKDIIVTYTCEHTATWQPMPGYTAPAYARKIQHLINDKDLTCPTCQLEAAEIAEQIAALKELVLKWQGLATSATAHFAYHSPEWTAEKKELDKQTLEIVLKEALPDDDEPDFPPEDENAYEKRMEQERQFQHMHQESHDWGQSLYNEGLIDEAFS